MDVAITALRAELASYIERARAGEEIVVTDRGTPVVRLLAVDTAPLIDRLTRDGILGPPLRTERPVARAEDLVHADGPVSDYVADHRR